MRTKAAGCSPICSATCGRSASRSSRACAATRSPADSGSRARATSIVAADDAVFGTPEINVGLWPYMITVPLLRSMSPKTALDLMMTGRRVDAHEGQRLGFVQRVVPVAELDATVDALAGELASKSPLIMKWGRDAFYRVLEMDADQALAYLQGMLTVTTLTEDSAEGVAAFAEKRPPEWKGR